MFGRRITLFKLLGFEVKVDVSWLVIAVLISWTLAQGLFPHYFEGLSNRAYWFMGIAGALGLFLSIIFHELCHSLVARRYGLPMTGITLFIFGGVAEMSEEPQSPKAEFMMAIAGPASSVLLGALMYAAHFLALGLDVPVYVSGVLWYLALINVLLAAFNMLPAFPLDGGRVLRSALWWWKKNLKWATRTASQAGSLFGLILIVLGLMSVLTGNLIGGIWWFLIGMFLRNAAQSSYRQVLLRKALEGEPVRKLMIENPVTVSPSTSLEELAESYFMKYHYKMFPVVENGRLLGCISMEQAKEIPRDRWGERRVGDLAEGCSGENTIPPESDVMEALSAMNRRGKSRLMVVEDGRLLGIITTRDIMRHFSVKLELEESGE
ncbi:MAG: site-2 protease family protein [Nitrospirota bacterium]|jgi:Zn-dependent protease/predicted transcriptional regulator